MRARARERECGREPNQTMFAKIMCTSRQLIQGGGEGGRRERARERERASERERGRGRERERKGGRENIYLFLFCW